MCIAQQCCAAAADGGFAETDLRYRRLWATTDLAKLLGRREGFACAIIGFTPCRTPYRSPQSNSVAKSFVKTYKRKYADINPTPDALTVLERLPIWIADYNELHRIARCVIVRRMSSEMAV